MADFTRNLGSASASSGELKKFRVKKKDPLVLSEKVKAEISLLPSNYNFEIEKTLEKIYREKPSTVALQFPEGLHMYACIIANVIIKFCGARVLILGDVAYGACCVDDFTARKLGADLLVHYGHSCLVPLQVTTLKMLYVFVEITFDTSHLISTLQSNFDSTSKIALMGTIQFVSALSGIKRATADNFPHLIIPQCKPLSSGETLGCTSPVITESDIVIFVADGRFHLEAVMIQNPQLLFYRYDPYSKILSREGYHIDEMKGRRREAIEQARQGKIFGLILGSLGRQGNVKIFDRLQKLLIAHQKKVIPFVMAEIQVAKLAKIPQIDVWVQVACPRLSIDWGTEFNKPLLNAYELEVTLGSTSWKERYPMDYYSAEGGSWTNYHA